MEAAQAALLGSATATGQPGGGAIVATVRNRAADGVNLDFEPVSTTLRDQYTSFVRQLKAGLVAAGVRSHLTVCTMAGAATWATGYDLAGLTAPGAADAVFVMGYDYSWSGSARRRRRAHGLALHPRRARIGRRLPVGDPR